MRRIPVSLALAAMSLAVSSASSPASWPPQPIADWVIEEDRGISAVTVDAHGNLFVINGWHVEKYDAAGKFVLGFFTGGEGAFLAPRGVAVDDQGKIYVVDTYASRIQVLTDGLEPVATWAPSGWLDYPEAIAIGADAIYVKTQQEIQKLSREGAPMARWDAPSASGLAVDPDGNVWLAGWGLFHKYDPEGTLLETLGGRQPFDNANGFVVDETGIFVTDFGDQILAFDRQGIYRGSFGEHTQLAGLTLDSTGRLYAVDGYGTVTRYGLISSLPLPPPPPALGASAVILHIASTGDPSTACATGPETVSEVVTQGDARSDGSARYFVYVLALPRSATQGIRGMQFGIVHDDIGGEADPLEILGWTSCSDIEWPTDTWPAPGAGNTLTWASCRFRPIVIGGYFEVAAYDAAAMAIAPYPATPFAVKTANCDVSENKVDQVLGLERVGWVSLGGAARGLDTDGCNPGLDPCVAAKVPAEPTTWGRLKTLYGGSK